MMQHRSRTGVLGWLLVAGGLAGWGVTGCAHAPGSDSAPSALEMAAAADDEDLGDPRPAPQELEAEEEQALLDDPSATRLDFDGVEENYYPTDMVVIPPDREPMPSLMQEITLGPSS